MNLQKISWPDPIFNGVLRPDQPGSGDRRDEDSEVQNGLLSHGVPALIATPDASCRLKPPVDPEDVPGKPGDIRDVPGLETRQGERNPSDDVEGNSSPVSRHLVPAALDRRSDRRGY